MFLPAMVWCVFTLLDKSPRLCSLDFSHDDRANDSRMHIATSLVLASPDDRPHCVIIFITKRGEGSSFLPRHRIGGPWPLFNGQGPKNKGAKSACFQSQVSRGEACSAGQANLSSESNHVILSGFFPLEFSPA